MSEPKGPCGTPLTPRGIAGYAFETFDGEHKFTQQEREWRYCHVVQLIEYLVDLRVQAASGEPPK